MNYIFKPIVNDLKILESEGISVNSKIVKGTIIAVLGDNLGSQIGGFQENFKDSSYFCRYCYAQDLSKIYYSSDVVNHRTITSYNDDVHFAEALDTIYKGVRRSSELNNLKYYHVDGQGLPPCMAHDIFEGILEYDLMLIINHLVKMKILSYQYINQQIKLLSFSAGFETVEIPEIKSNDKLIGSASQNLYLINILPFALANVSDHILLHAQSYWEM